jgi:hypothetical protein
MLPKLYKTQGPQQNCAAVHSLFSSQCLSVVCLFALTSEYQNENHKPISPSAMPMAGKKKKQQKGVSTEEKLNIINRLQLGEHIANTCPALGFTKSIVLTICDNAGKKERKKERKKKENKPN